MQARVTAVFRFCEGVEVVELGGRPNAVGHSLPSCACCGCENDRPEKRCAALTDGRCRP
mgnify:CR=1 FL=1